MSPAEAADDTVDRGDISSRVREGLAWVILARASQRGLRFVSTMVLARILAPSAFGLVAMALVTIQLLVVIREAGLGAALIHRRGTSPEDEALAADTTFWMMVILNGGLFLMAQAAAPLLAGFFDDPQLLPVLRVTLVVLAFDALQTVPDLLLAKALRFKKSAIVEVGGALSQIATAIPMALSGFGVWSIVFGHLVGRSVSTALAHRESGWTPHARFSGAIAGELYRYGRHLWAFSALSAAGGVLDRVLVGRLAGSASLGVYQNASTLAQLPFSQISAVVNRVSFPAFTKIRADEDALVAGLLNALTHVCILTVPLVAGMHYLAEELITLAYGERWLAAVAVFQVLALRGLVLSATALTGPMFMAIGRPKVLPITSVVHHAVLIASMFALAGYGITGIAWAVVIPHVFSGSIAFVLIHRYLGVPLGDLVGPLLRPLIAAAGMYVALAATERMIPSLGDLGALPRGIVLGLVGGAAYTLLSKVVNPEGTARFQDTLGRALRRATGRKRELPAGADHRS